MNCDNQTVIAKVNNSKDNAKSSRHVKRRLKSVKKLRNNCYVYSNRQKTVRSFYKGAITKCDRYCIEGDGYETHRRYTIVVTQPL